MKPTWSIIICSIDASRFAQVSQCYERLLAGRPHEIIGIHDATSLSSGYNRGIRQARGDILVFSHDDILILDPAFAEKVESRIDSGFQLLGFVGSTALKDGYWWSGGQQHMRGVMAHAIPTVRQLSINVYGVTGNAVEQDIQALDGLCFIASRETVDQLRFDDEQFNGFHLYDLDYSYRAHLLGLRIGVMTDIPMIHMSTGIFGQDWNLFRQRFVDKHADQLGVLRHVPLAEPLAMRCRAAWFDDVTAMLQVWQAEHLCRATIALQRAL